MKSLKARPQGYKFMSQRHLRFKGGKTPTQLLRAEPQPLSKAGCGCFQIFSLPAKNPFSCSFPWPTHPLQEHPTSFNARRQGVDFTAILPQSPARERSPGKPPDPPGCTSLAHQPCICLCWLQNYFQVSAPLWPCLLAKGKQKGSSELPLRWGKVLLQMTSKSPLQP